jgi:molybdopterin converting factor small subunit
VIHRQRDDLHQPLGRGKAARAGKEGRMQVVFYGKLAERIDRALTIELPEHAKTVEDLRALLADRFPDARTELLRPSLRACIGDELVQGSHSLQGVNAVEFFPPVSGG